MREGLSSAAADRYCGALEQQIYGYGSQKHKYGLSNQMSEQFTEDEATVEIAQPAVAEIVSAVANTIDAIEAGDVTETNLNQLEHALDVAAEYVNIEEVAPEA